MAENILVGIIGIGGKGGAAGKGGEAGVWFNVSMKEQLLNIYSQ